MAKISHTKLKFDNLPPDARIQIYTLSGETVIYYFMPGYSKYEWDCRNVSNDEVSPGIYYYIIYWDDWKRKITGKIFLTR
jgi:hypothetical protein